MFSGVTNLFLQITGGLKHTANWVKSGTTDMVIKNPRFKPHKGFENGIALYCIPGTADRSFAFKTFADQIINNLPPLISSIHLLSFDGLIGAGIPDYAKLLEQKILTNGDENAIFLGHSRGGIVASYFDIHLAKQANVKIHGIIPSCGPYQGNKVPIISAFLSLFSTSVQQMQKNSKLLTELATGIEQSSTPYYEIAAENDFLVAVDDACIAAHRNQLRVIPRHGHLSITSSHTWVRYIHSCLTEICQSLVPEMEVVPISIDAEYSIELIDPTSEKTMISICKEIDEQIFHLAQRIHLFGASQKADVLLNLRTSLMEMLEGAHNNYQGVQTVGGYIQAFINDGPKDQRPIDILNAQLNFPISVFQKKKPDSVIFIERLIEKYKDIPLHVESTPLSAECNESESDFHLPRLNP